jgi:tetratricopeptide (TPR) repeat protein
LLAGLVLLFLGCGGAARKQQPTAQGPSRIAVLRCENLSPDTSLDWMGRAFSEIISAQISGSAGAQVVPLATLRAASRPPAAPGISAEREAAVAAGANRIVYCSFSTLGTNLHLSAAMEDVSSERTVLRAHAEAPLAGGLFSAAGSVARALSGGQVRAFGTRSQDAAHAWASALDQTDPAAASADFARAVAADPDFGAVYVAWLETEIARHDNSSADHVLELAQARAATIPEFDRARLALVAAEMRHDDAARRSALATLSKLDPADISVQRGLAGAAMQGRRYREAIQALHKVLAAAPDDISALNSLGYAEAYQGDLDAALEALRRYEKLQPAQANPLDSQGDVNFYFNRYAEAEKLYLAAQQKDPNFLGGGEFLKAAQARLSTGDIAGADGLFARYLAPLESRHEPNALYTKSLWLYTTGRRREAADTLRPAAEKLPGLAAQLAIWDLAAGDRRAALEHANKAAQSAQGRSTLLIPVALYLSQPDASPAEWQSRAVRLFPQPAQAGVRDQMAAVALLFRRQFRDAVPLLRQAYDLAGQNAENLPVLLAWAMVESGDWNGVTGLIGPTPIPPEGGLGWLSSLHFPRLFYLRGRNLDRMGKHDQAIENYRLFLKLSGDTPEIWGDEQRAREAVGSR